MTKEIGRTENKARYEKCVEEFKRSFAEYRAAFEADTKEMLVWSGEYYKLKENGEFFSLKMLMVLHLRLTNMNLTI